MLLRSWQHMARISWFGAGRASSGPKVKGTCEIAESRNVCSSIWLVCAMVTDTWHMIILLQTAGCMTLGSGCIELVNRKRGHGADRGVSRSWQLGWSWCQERRDFRGKGMGHFSMPAIEKEDRCFTWLDLGRQPMARFFIRLIGNALELDIAVADRLLVRLSGSFAKTRRSFLRQVLLQATFAPSLARIECWVQKRSPSGFGQFQFQREAPFLKWLVGLSTLYLHVHDLLCKHCLHINKKKKLPKTHSIEQKDFKVWRRYKELLERINIPTSQPFSPNVETTSSISQITSRGYRAFSFLPWGSSTFPPFLYPLFHIVSG